MRKLVLATLLLVMLTGCFGEACRNYAPSAPMTAADVVGSWQDATSGAVLRFTADGKFEATDIAARLYSGDLRESRPSFFDESRDRLDGSGTWQLDTDKNGTISVIKLQIDELSVGPLSVSENRTTSVYAQLSDSTVVLGGMGRVYVKCANDCGPTPAASTPVTRRS